MRKHKARKMKIMRNNFIESEVSSRMLSYRDLIYPHNCSQIPTIESPNNLSATDFLKGYTILNFCYYGDYDPRVDVFMKQHAKRNMKTNALGIREFSKCVRRRNIDFDDAKKIYALFGRYLSTEKPHTRKEKIEYNKELDLYRCLVSKEKYSTSESCSTLIRYSFPDMKECFDQYYQPIKNTSKNLRPLAPSSNSSYLKPLPNPNQDNNYSTIFMVIILFIFSIISLLYCKHGNKLLHRNENADRDLPMNQLGNKKTRRSSSIKYAESPCLKLANCIGSYEPKRGY
ncbi:hypothetical protein [Candidatus Mesenet endosymbiont of Phosphuga atrata]|uniref:hypothetical protein n=1 Tax=Candidatus Mesenet endosymbiont of Phosphuga atrata TaxID=3066221 RepID=UPI0030D3540A